MKTPNIKHFTNSKLSETQVLDNLNEFGVSVVTDIDANIPSLQHECENLLENIGNDSYAFGKIASPILHGKTNPNLKLTNTLLAFFSNELFKSISKQYIGHDGRFLDDLYISNEFRNDLEMARNGFLHFDRHWALKFMLYLSDVDTESGPLSLVPRSHKLGKKLRINAHKEHTEYQSVRNRLDIDYPEVAYEKPIPITGKAGTLIVFDTDTFHFGGRVNDRKTRLIVRSHCRANTLK